MTINTWSRFPHTLPVRSPLPKRQPSTLSAPGADHTDLEPPTSKKRMPCLPSWRALPQRCQCHDRCEGERWCTWVMADMWSSIRQSCTIRRNHNILLGYQKFWIRKPGVFQLLRAPDLPDFSHSSETVWNNVKQRETHCKTMRRNGKQFEALCNLKLEDVSKFTLGIGCPPSLTPEGATIHKTALIERVSCWVVDEGATIQQIVELVIIQVVHVDVVTLACGIGHVVPVVLPLFSHLISRDQPNVNLENRENEFQ